MNEEQIKEARKLLESAQSLINTPAGYAIFNKINRVLRLLSEPCETCGGTKIIMQETDEIDDEGEIICNIISCPDCQPAEPSEKMLKHMLLERNKDIASVEIAYQAEIRKLNSALADRDTRIEKYQKLLKWFWNQFEAIKEKKE